MQSKTIDIGRVATSWTRRAFLKTSGVVVGGFSIVPQPWTGAPAQRFTNIRKNIDSLSQAELQRYVDAVQELVNRSDKDKMGYQYLANLHNTRCEHHWSPFLPWHRAHLWRFEQALQSVDAGVTLPYWDWSKPPSGARYARAFEDSNTVLIDDVTGFDNRNRPAHPGPPYGLDVLEDTIRNSRGNWGKWGGGTTNGNPGFFELPSHDDMHGNYIGGAMGAVPTAANDPIFYSFHAFIDLFWVRWQRTWGWDRTTMLDYPLGGMENTEVRDVVDIQDLDYDYDNAPPVTLLPPLALASAVVPTTAMAANDFPRTHPDVAAAASTDEPDVIYGFDIKIPARGFDVAEIVLADIGYSTTLSYRGYVYIHPKTVGFNPQEKDFGDQYLVNFYSVWQAMTEGVKTNTVIDVSTFMNYLAATTPGEEWRVSIAISPTFTTQRLAEALGTARITALAEETSIGGFSLELSN